MREKILPWLALASTPALLLIPEYMAWQFDPFSGGKLIHLLVLLVVSIVFFLPLGFCRRRVKIYSLLSLPFFFLAPFAILYYHLFQKRLTVELIVVIRESNLNEALEVMGGLWQYWGTGLIISGLIFAHSYVFTENLKAKVIFLLPFEEMPESARHYITYRAC
ncbi:MAG: hypothetical protein AAF206_19805, partial [Bacteroidota bacterium]